MARPKTLSAAFARVRQEQRLLYEWLRQHHDTFAAELGALRPRDRWKRALRVITAEKLVDDRGNPVTRDTAIRTWKRVRQDVAAVKAKRHVAPPAALAPGEIAPGVRATSQPAKAQTAAAGAWATSSVTSQTDQPSMPGPSSRTPGADGENEAMRRLRASMDAGKVPMPKTLR